MAERTTRVLIVDDHPVVRAGLVAMLDQLPDVTIVAEAATGAEAMNAVDTHHVDVVILDLNLPDTSGERITAAITSRDPSIAVLILTMEQDDTHLIAALRAGAKGYLLKGAPPTELIGAIRAVATGELIIGAGSAEHVSAYLRHGRTPVEAAFPDLTDRERQVLALLADSATNNEIARRLTIRPKTVRNLVSLVLVKTTARDRADAILRARAAGLGAPPS